MPITFDALARAYPTAERPEFYQALGGQWPRLVNDPNYQNTCATRMSVALKGAGAAIPNELKEALDGSGSPLIVRVMTMERLITRLLGQSYWGMSKQPGVPVAAADLPARRGILAYHAQWSDATGHFDLWTGSAFVGKGRLDAIRDGYDVQLWRVD
jgi:hypothetical protein